MAFALVCADFAELEQVSAMAREVRDKHRQLSRLVNARMTPGSGQRVITTDGNERTFQINYLAPYLLTRTLHEPLAATPGSRIINTGSILHRGGNISWRDLNRTHRYTQLAVYAQSMLAVSMFTQLAAQLWSDSCVAVCTDPGTTDPALLRLYGPSVRPSTDSADVLARLGDPDFSPVNGAFYERLQAAPATPPISGERALARLWKRSATITGLR